MTGLRDRPVLVTGAASGIGRATAERLAHEGARVGLIDRNTALLDELVRALITSGARALALPADVSQEDAMTAAVERAVRELGGLGGVVTSAGIFAPGDMQLAGDVDLATFSHTLDVNLKGTFLALKLALPHLVRSHGGIVTIASTAGLRGHGHGAGYTASKGGVIALTRLVATQYGGQGVRANCICPGATDTPMTGGVWRQPERARELERRVPLKRVGLPEEIGNTACFLLSDDAAYMTGQVIAVDGGATIV